MLRARSDKEISDRRTACFFAGSRVCRPHENRPRGPSGCNVGATFPGAATGPLGWEALGKAPSLGRMPARAGMHAAQGARAGRVRQEKFRHRFGIPPITEWRRANRTRAATGVRRLTRRKALPYPDVRFANIGQASPGDHAAGPLDRSASPAGAAPPARFVQLPRTDGRRTAGRTRGQPRGSQRS